MSRYNFEDLEIGVQYVAGGNDVCKGIDCMGLVAHILDKREIKSDHLKDRTHATFMKEVEENWEPFDLEKQIVGDRTVVVGFLNPDDKVDHVAVMVNNDEFYHAPDSKGITRSFMNRPFWHRQKKIFYAHKTK